jgi:drug/metabolite transporter (DMT)-like permease
MENPTGRSCRRPSVSEEGIRHLAAGTLYALGAALSFGASPPFVKLLLPNAGAVVVAALLYLGAGLALSLVALVPRVRRSDEAPLRSADVPILAAIIAFGGILGPVLMVWGLARVSGLLGSLLLNLEMPFTALLAVLLFGDHLGLRGAFAAALVVSGAVVLGGASSGVAGDPIGALAIAGACASWALDNNMTARLSHRDPIALARVKSLGAAACLLGLIAARGEDLPAAGVAASILLLGFVSYGASLVLAVRAMRVLGAARQAAIFASAPFAGALLAMPLLGERPTAAVVAAGALISTGIVLLVRERHSHRHEHETLDHEHLHVHDSHHRHVHEAGTPPAEPHSHPHRHAPLTHSHPHAPDVHHRHRH